MNVAGHRDLKVPRGPPGEAGPDSGQGRGGRGAVAAGVRAVSADGRAAAGLPRDRDVAAAHAEPPAVQPLVPLAAQANGLARHPGPQRGGRAVLHTQVGLRQSRSREV